MVSCNAPTLDGTTVVRVMAQSSGPSVSFGITLSPGKIQVVVGSGSGTDYRSREFEGTGVTGFDAAVGAQVDTALAETHPAGSNPGSLGAVTSVKGMVDCGDQTIGTSTVSYVGDIAEGHVSAGPNPFRVECANYSGSNTVTLAGVVTIGGTRTFFFASFVADAINIFETVAGPPIVSHQFFVKTPGTSTLSATGAHISGDAVEQRPTGVLHTLHVEGDVTCGAVVNR